MNRELLERVCNAPGIPGFEDAVQRIATEVLTGCCDEVRRDHMGNVIALRKARIQPAAGKTPLRLMLAAHSDEIGFMVKHINGSGYIHFIQVGGINAQVSESQRVMIHGRETVRGVIVPKTNGADKPAVLKDMLIDTGLSKDELAERGISAGDPITYEDDVSLLNGKMWVGRNFDDRIGTYSLLEAMRTVGDTAVDVFAVSTVQEEVGLRGAGPSAFSCAPDMAIAIDGSMACGAHVADYENLCDPGSGTGIYMIDNLTIGHPKLVRYLFDMCEKHKIPYQRNIGGGTDAKAIQQSRGGVIATTVGAPTRYMHSTVQLCHADDMDATVALLVKFMETAHEFHANLGY